MEPTRAADKAIIIDPELCTGCGACLAVCPLGTLTLAEGKARATGPRTLLCGHCQAACPTGAITVRGLDPQLFAFETFETDEVWLPPGRADLPGLVRLMRSRRSCRTFAEKSVDPARLRDLARIGASAPSGTNSQCWTFGLIPERSGMLALGRAVAGFFTRLNRQAANPVLRTLLACLGRRELATYYHEHYRSVAAALKEFTDSGRDLLFHGAPAAIVVAERPGASTPVEDSLLASQNILLAAHAMGLGTCLIGYAVAAMSRDKSIQTAIGIPAEEAVHAVIVLGWPAESYRRPAGRLTPVIRSLG